MPPNVICRSKSKGYGYVNSAPSGYSVRFFQVKDSEEDKIMTRVTIESNGRVSCVIGDEKS